MFEQKTYHKKWYQQNKEKEKLRAKLWKMRNKDKVKKIEREYRKRNRDKINKSQREYSKKYPERKKTQYHTYRDKPRKSKCLLCGDTRYLHFHHTNYKKDEGFTLCAKCHKKIHKS